jgi:hypothetical protein
MVDMKSPIPGRLVMPIEHLFGEDPEDTETLRAMAVDAERYLGASLGASQSKSVTSARALGKSSPFFCFAFAPASRTLMNGSGLLSETCRRRTSSIDSCKTPCQALEGYICEMRGWVELARDGQMSRDVIPVNVPATPEWAKGLVGRLQFLESHVLPGWREDEIERTYLLKQ